MQIVLNKRQLDILEKLENSKQYITATALANAYDVSIRTIRSDINEITYFLKEYDCVFEKIPHVGMRIISKAPIVKQINENFDLTDFVVFDNEIRRDLLILTILAHSNEYITLNYLSDLFYVSKGTLIRNIEDLDVTLNEYSLRLKGIKSKGFKITGRDVNKAQLLRDLLFKKELESYVDALVKQEDVLYECSCFVEQLADYLGESGDFLITNRREFVVMTTFYILVPLLEEENIIDSVPEAIEKLVNYVKENSDYELPLSSAFYKILYQCTSFKNPTLPSLELDKDFEKGLEVMIDKIIELRPNLMYDIVQLKHDLTMHLQTTLERQMYGYSLDNPLLSEIKLHNIEAFNIAKSASNEFTKYYKGITFTDDEIGFVTLYICLYLEKQESINEARVMVVCNSGVGASRLLTNRIMNAFPEIHITLIKPYIDIYKDAEFLKNIDLIVSTVDLPSNIDTPYIIVSPFLSEKELTKIRESIWQVNKIKKHLINTGHETDLQSIEPVEIENANNIYGNNVSYYQVASVVMEAMNLLASIYPARIERNNYVLVQGLLAHIVMSVERWTNQDFLIVYDYEEMKEQYRYEFDMVIEFLDKVSKLLNIFIDPVESIAILRYIILNKND